MDDNDGRFSDDSLVEVRYPRTRQEELGDRSAWLWLPGSILAGVSDDHAPCQGVLPGGEGFGGPFGPMT